MCKGWINSVFWGGGSIYVYSTNKGNFHFISLPYILSFEFRDHSKWDKPYLCVGVHICVCILSMSTTTKGLRGWHILLTAFTVCVRNTISPCILVTTLCTLCILFVNVHLVTICFHLHPLIILQYCSFVCAINAPNPIT